jgi:hypothetical protein
MKTDRELLNEAWVLIDALNKAYDHTLEELKEAVALVQRYQKLVDKMADPLAGCNNPFLSWNFRNDTGENKNEGSS